MLTGIDGIKETSIPFFYFTDAIKLEHFFFHLCRESTRIEKGKKKKRKKKVGYKDSIDFPIPQRKMR